MMATMKSSILRLSVAVMAISLSLAGIQAQTVTFDALQVKGGKKSESSCVVLNATGTLATVVSLGSDPRKASIVVDEKRVPLVYIASDINSRLAIYRLPDGVKPLSAEAVDLGSTRGLAPSESLFLSGAEKSPVKLVGRVSKFQGKTLPVAVLRLNHGKAAPAPGSGVVNAAGKLVGIVRQTAFDVPTSSYCLPVEVISRTLKDHGKNGKVRRCWIGIVMDELVDPPIVESVRPESPASKAGLQKGDVLLSIGDQSVEDYSEVVDAFFYLVAGEPTVFKVLRGTEVKEHSVMPEANPGQ